MIANVLRLESPERAASLISKASGALAPGGDMLIVDAWPGDTDEAALVFAFYSLNLATRTGSAEPHALIDIKEWVEDAGLDVSKTVHLDGGQNGALFALKPE